ncbi:MAG: exodeoxyribonuclease III [Actinobacteria bacterium]|nr:exodeoxyribonuclease III [Actinomycetota bacterium]
MLVATWNVNSLKARLPRVQAWLEEAQPDVLCMQETKMKQEVFPTEVFTEMGYESAHFGQGQWNGVAILSKVGLTDVVQNFAVGDPDTDARIISATCGGAKVVCVYVPNGRELDHEHYQYKLRWMKQLRQHVDTIATPSDDVIVTGDFNIAPLDIDVWDPAALEGSTHVSESSASSTQSQSCIHGGTIATAVSIKATACASTICWFQNRLLNAPPKPPSIATRARAKSQAITRQCY